MKASWVLAALLALGGVAEAGTKTQVIGLDGHCDVLTLKINKTAVAGTDDPNCIAGFGGGFIGKVKGFGNAIVTGVQFPGRPAKQFVLRIAYPLVTGGKWDLYVTSDGVTLSKFQSGIYTVQGTPQHGVKGTTPAVDGRR